MKRVLSVLLAISCALAISVPAFAAISASGGTGDAVLTYDVPQSFTVTIPESVTISPGTRQGSSTVTVADAIIPYGESLKVSITQASNYSSGYRLKDGENDSYVSYTIKNSSEDVSLNSAFLTIPAGVAAGSATLDYAASAPTRAGIFTGTLTFTVVVS